MLPDWDDGAKDREETLAMVKTFKKDGITEE